MYLRDVVLPRFLILALGAMLLFSIVACGGDDDEDGGATVTSTLAGATTVEAEGPGTITLTSSAIEGQSGKILLVFAIPSGGGERVARLCAPIQSDSFTLSVAVMTEVPAGNDPCGDGSAEAMLDEGTYTLTAGIYVGGEQTPEAEVTLTVEVAGDMTAELNGADLSG